MDDVDLQAYVVAALELQQLHLDEIRQAAVVEQFHLMQQMAQLFLEQAQAPHEESAAVYRL